MKPRESRRKVLLKARMRDSSGWHDACIVDLSTRGVGLQAADPPAPGSYLEIRRGTHCLIAKVVWRRSHRFGVVAQDRVAVDALERDLPASASVQCFSERRQHLRSTTPLRKEARDSGRWLEWTAAAVCVTLSAVGLGSFVWDALATPLHAVAVALG